MLRAFTLWVILLSCSGCATVVSRNSTDFADRIYPATTMDAIVVWMAVSPSSIIGDAHSAAEVPVRVLMLIGGVVDLPVSVVTDTICLPYDMKQNRKRIAAIKASYLSLEEILNAYVPPDSEVLDCPPKEEGPWRLLGEPTVMLAGLGLNWEVDGGRRQYRYPGRPGYCITTLNLESQKGDMHLLVIIDKKNKVLKQHNTNLEPISGSQ